MLTQGERLKKIRDYLELSRQEFYELIEIGQSYLSMIERGERPISARITKKIALKIPSINIDWLLTGRGEMIRKSSDDSIVQSTGKSVQGNEGFVQAVEQFGVNDPPGVYSDLQKEIACLRHRIKALEQFISNKFPDFDTGKFKKED
ncbi:MAG TPA: helix-turn-helix transcriptional regulator [Saprospiraceae bacterium]|nr:helix-turn-helix transcriptional regulator [Saprospiraceae bacterium]HMP14425.1 helix-turn-helix transcriptional regulator [Saprospiraceae bacterium]